jgi:peroxiredoxin
MQVQIPIEFRPVLGLGDEVPNFSAKTQKGSLTFHDYITGSWAMLFSHPADYTPVCTTEIGMVAKLKNEFDGRDCKVVGISVDSISNHQGWIKDINETQGTNVDFPIVADEDGKIAVRFGFYHPNSPNAQTEKRTVRSVIIIDPNRKVQLKMDYPTFVGRNFYEILRALDALQLSLYKKVATPANWKVGDDVMILPSVNNEMATELFTKGFTEIKPYLRITPQPDIN